MIMREFGGSSGLWSDCLSDCPVTSLKWSNFMTSWGDTPVTSWGDTAHPGSEKPQQDGRHWSSNCAALEWLWGDTPCPGAKEKSQKMVGESNSNPIPSRDAQRVRTNLGRTRAQGPRRDWDRTVWVCPMEIWVSSGLPQGQGLWVQQTWVWHKPSWRMRPLIPPQSCQNLHRTGK